MDGRLLGVIQAAWHTLQTMQQSLAGIHTELATANTIRLWELEPKEHHMHSMTVKERNNAIAADYENLIRRTHLHHAKQ